MLFGNKVSSGNRTGWILLMRPAAKTEQEVPQQCHPTKTTAYLE
jgi:hypothetical protein